MTTEFYGSVNKMPDDLLTSKLAEAQKMVTEYTRECKRRDQFTSSERLADKLHHLLHERRGLDCDYHYSDWGVGPLTTCRSEFKGIAQKLEAWRLGEKDLNDMLAILEGK